MRINYNTAAANATRNLGSVQNKLGSSVEKLSSGFRINRAADDSAGLVVSENLRSEIRGLKTAERNGLDAVSLVQTAEGAGQEVTNILQRMRELAVSAANTGTTDGTAQQAEFAELMLELDDINDKTNFAGSQIFDGAARTFQIGANAGDTLDITFQSVDSTTLAINAEDVSVDASAAITALDSALDTVLSFRGDLGAKQNRLESRLSNLGVQVENLSSSESRVRDTDMAKESAEFTRANILSQAGTAVLAQANQLPQGVLRLLG